MEVEFDRDLHRERLQDVWGWQLGNQLACICHVDLLSEQSWAQVKIKAALKMLTDEVLVQGDFAQGFKFLRKVVDLAILFIVFLPLLFLLLVEEELLRWIKRFSVLG